MSTPHLIKADQQAFNRLAETCSNHRMIQTAYEVIYATKYEYGDPIEEVYTFTCKGTCQQSYQQTIKNK